MAFFRIGFCIILSGFHVGVSGHLVRMFARDIRIQPFRMLGNFRTRPYLRDQLHTQPIPLPQLKETLSTMSADADFYQGYLTHRGLGVRTNSYFSVGNYSKMWHGKRLARLFGEPRFLVVLVVVGTGEPKPFLGDPFQKGMGTEAFWGDP